MPWSGSKCMNGMFDFPPYSAAEQVIPSFSGNREVRLDEDGMEVEFTFVQHGTTLCGTAASWSAPGSWWGSSPSSTNNAPLPAPGMDGGQGTGRRKQIQPHVRHGPDQPTAGSNVRPISRNEANRLSVLAEHRRR